MGFPRRFTIARAIAAIVLVVALAWFIVRTMPRGGYWMWDFGVVSEASRAWVAGENPYDEPSLRRRWRADPADGLLESIDAVESLVPPPTLAVVAPMSMLPRRAALVTWYALQWALLAAMIATLWSIARLAPWQPGAILLAAAVLLLGPVQSGVQAGQTSLPAVACIVFAIALDLRGRPIAAGIMLAIAMALKLQLAVPFVVYYAFVGRWRTAAAAACLFAAIALIAVARLEFANVPWLSAWLANVRRSTGPGGMNDFANGVAIDHLLNLHLPLYSIIGHRLLTQLCAWLVFLLFAGVYAIRLRRALRDEPADDAPTDRLLLVAPAAVLALLPVYHRYYDATLLVIPLTWAVATLAATATSTTRRCAIIALALMTPFVLPVGWATNLINRGYVAASLASRPWWRIGVMSLQVWLLVLLAIALIAAIPRRRHRPRGRDEN